MQLDDLFANDKPHATFHDACIERLTLDYVSREAALDCSICVGDPDSADETVREARRNGRLVISGLLYCVIDPPDPAYPYAEAGGLCLSDDGAVGTQAILGEQLPPNQPEGSFAHYFFVSDWNACITSQAEPPTLNGQIKAPASLAEPLPLP